MGQTNAVATPIVLAKININRILIADIAKKDLSVDCSKVSASMTGESIWMCNLQPSSSIQMSGSCLRLVSMGYQSMAFLRHGSQL